MRVAIYARVSTLDQQTLPLQIEALEAFAKHRGWLVVACIKEVASGAKDDRAGRAEVLALARRRQVDVVLVWNPQRQLLFPSNDNYFSSFRNCSRGGRLERRP